MGTWIAEWYNTQLRTSECCTLGCEFNPKREQTFLAWIYTQEFSEEDEIKTGNTKINTIICYLFVNLCCLWKLENHKNGIKLTYT